jgi:hypothetical protein
VPHLDEGTSMKFRTGVLLGIGIGFALGRKAMQQLTADDPNVVKGPQREQSSGLGSNPAIRLVTGGAARLTDQATVKSLDAIRRTRSAIQKRLYEPEDAAWN